MILDSHNRIRLLDHGIAIRREEAFGKYFSVFPMQLPVEDFCISGAKYPLQNHLLSSGDSLCVSNEFAEGEDVFRVWKSDFDGDERLKFRPHYSIILDAILGLLFVKESHNRK